MWQPVACHGADRTPKLAFFGGGEGGGGGGGGVT